MGEGFIVVVGVMWFILATYVASEADKENRSTGFWFVFTLIFGIFALILWAARGNKGRVAEPDRYQKSNSSFFDHEEIALKILFAILLLSGLAVIKAGIEGGSVGVVMLGATVAAIGFVFQQLSGRVAKSDQ